MRSTLLFNFIGALLVCSAVLAGYGVWYAAIASKSAAVAHLQNQIDTTNENASRATSARAALAEIADDEATVQNYFIPETGVVVFINDLETRGRSQGAAINVLSVSTSGTSIQPTLTLSLTIGGTFDAVMRTVGMIEYAPYNISIITISLTHEATVWRASLNMIVGSVPVSTKKSAQAIIMSPRVRSPLSPYAYF